MLQTRNISKWKEILEIYFKIVKISYPSSVILNETSCTIGIDNRIARVEGRFKGDLLSILRSCRKYNDPPFEEQLKSVSLTGERPLWIVS